MWKLLPPSAVTEEDELLTLVIPGYTLQVGLRFGSGRVRFHVLAVCCGAWLPLQRSFSCRASDTSRTGTVHPLSHPLTAQCMDPSVPAVFHSGAPLAAPGWHLAPLAICCVPIEHAW